MVVGSKGYVGVSALHAFDPTFKFVLKTPSVDEAKEVRVWKCVRLMRSYHSADYRNVQLDSRTNSTAGERDGTR